MKVQTEGSSKLRRIAEGAFIGGIVGLVLILLLGVLSYIAESNDWRTEDFFEILTGLGVQSFFAFIHYGILLLPLCSLAGILLTLTGESRSHS